MGGDHYSRVSLLRSLANREHLLSGTSTSLPSGACLVTLWDREREATWIVASGAALSLGVDTVCLAVALLDRVLVATRVPVKYVNCVAATCLYISIKLCEECVCVSDAGRLISRLQLHYSIPELNRMELTILSHLNWDLGMPSVDRFMHAMLRCMGSPFLPVFRIPLETVICSSALSYKFRPSLLALALLSLILESRTPFWFPVTVGFQRLLEVDDNELIECREAIATVICLEDKENDSARELKRSRGAKRKADGGRKEVHEVLPEVALCTQQD
uniref:Cyclin-like domain-containing protein n=1 Tax=Parascaris univalens TaxID=6257 RepID=A0A915AUD4_PARUN